MVRVWIGRSLHLLGQWYNELFSSIYLVVIQVIGSFQCFKRDLEFKSYKKTQIQIKTMMHNVSLIFLCECVFRDRIIPRPQFHSYIDEFDSKEMNK